MEPLKWIDDKFECVETPDSLLGIRGEILIPVILPEEPQVYLVHVNTETLQVTNYVALQYEVEEYANSANSNDISPNNSF